MRIALAWRGKIRSAPLAGTEPGSFGFTCGGEEGDVFAARRARTAGRPAIHAGRADCIEECAIRRRVTRRDGTPALLGGGFGTVWQWCKIKMESTEKRRSRRYKSHKAFPFEITIEYAWNLFLKQDRKCALSGEPLTMWGKIDGKYQGTASLDRIDSSMGYVEGNVQWIEKKLQHMKRNMVDADFIKICKKVAAYQMKKGTKLSIPSFKEYMSKSELGTTNTV